MSVERLRHQAELQVRNDGLPPYLYELLPPEPPDPLDPEATWPQRGWAALPEPSPGDLFFDMEGDPYALDDEHGSGLEYLFGVIELDADRRAALPRVLGALPRRGEDRVRGLRRLRDEAPGRAPRPARVPLRALRAVGDEAAHGRAPHPRVARSTSCCAARCSSTSTRSCARRCASAASRTR